MSEPGRRKLEERGINESVEYNSLPQDDQSDTNGEMAKYRPPLKFVLFSKLKAIGSHPTFKCVIAIAGLILVVLWYTRYLWWPLPCPIVWSDAMHKKILSNPEQRLPERIVHFDLKGAAPRVAYLKELFPLLRESGATGVLMEWEDMFPYHGRLKVVRHGDAYSDQDIRSILETAKENNLRIIPLVQTFGHLEWVLKHKQFAGVREVARYPQVVCPSYNESLVLVKLLIDDIVDTHRDFIDTIHIGADEAYHVGKECKRCQKKIEELGGVDKLMLEYVTQVARYVKEKHSLKVMAWNDMFDKTEPKVLRSYGMDELVEPVIWGYAEYLFTKNYFPEGEFDRFGEVFDRLWVASAFKGADGSDQSFVNLPHYAQNHLSWLQVLNYYSGPLKSVRGIVLTGWQRFDHFAILCEILPAAIPSLVFNLQVVKYGGMKPELFDMTREYLHCSRVNWTIDTPEWESVIERFINFTRKLPKPPVLGTLRCDFPGSQIYALIERLRLVKHEYDVFMNSSYRRGWMHEYNMFHQYGSVHHAEITHNVTEALLYHFNDLGTKLQEELTKIYYDDTVTEWLFENVQVHVNQLRKLSLAAMQIKQTVEFRSRPLTNMKLDL